MKHKSLFIIFILIAFFPKAQNLSLRTNVLNLLAKGPSLAIGKQIIKNSESLLTFSKGTFAPFLRKDVYRYTTVHVENRWKDRLKLAGIDMYAGPYVRYIHRRIFSEGYTAGPYGIFSKEARDFNGHGVSIGLTSGAQWTIRERWIIDLNYMLGGGKYIKQHDYFNADKTAGFLDGRLALQLGVSF